MDFDWIAVDWGTTRLRAWAMDTSNRVVMRAASEKGMAGLEPDQFEPTLLELVGEWLPAAGTVDIIACGMVGARTGWIEAPYSAVPCRPLATGRTVAAPCRDSRIRVTILPGLCQQDPADVMRSEETQIAGAIGSDTHANGIVCVPGTHSKWVGIEHGQVVDFRTFMTGELFNILTRHSVLRPVLDSQGWDKDSYAGGVSDALDDPADVAGKLFALRARSLLEGLPAEAARSRLSGLLVGLELAAARLFWSGRQTMLISEGLMSEIYSSALEIAGGEVLHIDAEKATLNGLIEARRQLGTGRG